MSTTNELAALLEADGLTCGYPGRKVLSGVSFDLLPGSATVLLGPNGSGKSTLLKTLSKSIPPQAGLVRIEGADILTLSFGELARRIAYVPQEEVPPFRFSVRQVVLMGRLPLSAGFMDTPADHLAADAAMREADCFELQDRPLSELSGGERQRVLIARALAQQTQILLLDEPTSHLDVGHQVAIIELVRKLCRAGNAVLAALHDLNLASELGENAMLLNGGKIAMQASVEEVLSSEILDQTYAVPFRRLRDETGRLRVFADSGTLTAS